MNFNDTKIRTYNMEILNTNINNGIKTFRNDNYEGLIYYSGVGTKNNMHYFNENEFRQLIWKNMEKSKKLCPHDPRFCHILDIVSWSGAFLLRS